MSVCKNCTLLQISDCGSACAICKCVQGAWASLTVPKGRSGLAKTNFFLHRLSINEPILSILFFNFLINYQCTFPLLHLQLTFYNMKRLGFRATFLSTDKKASARTKLSQTTEPQLFYIVCCGALFAILFF